jgi:hypothetical protein
MIRPGPIALPEGLCPDGVIIHIYATTVPPTLILTRRYGPDDDMETGVRRDWATVEACGYPGVCLVAFDGDTGDRFPADWWEARP